jgi:hypothetical protein
LKPSMKTPYPLSGKSRRTATQSSLVYEKE